MREHMAMPDAQLLEYWTESNRMPNIQYSTEVIEEGGGYTLELQVVIDDEEALPYGVPVEIQMKGTREPYVDVILLTERSTRHRVEGLTKPPRSVVLNPESRVLMGKISKLR